MFTVGTRIWVIDKEKAAAVKANVENGQRGTVIIAPNPAGFLAKMRYVQMDDGPGCWLPVNSIKRIHRAKVEV
ncbi:MAG: hypothetical protein PHG35_03490 [Dehalococcoidales bacterium]|nr:hypothetical protein [Dehalococcoidales bacterium]